MWKCLGICCMFGGMIGVLYSWICQQQENQKRLAQFELFLQKSRYVMQQEKMKIVDYFSKYIAHNLQEDESEDMVLERVLEKIIQRLSTNTYPDGQMVWEEVFKEEEQNLHFDRETFQIFIKAGNGFFGKSREENIRFMDKSIEELEQQQVKIRQKNAQERKVWLPVGMLGTVMLVILFL